MSKKYDGAEKSLLETVNAAVSPDYYLSLSTEEPTATDTHELDGCHYARLKWEGSGKTYECPTFIFESAPYYEENEA